MPELALLGEYHELCLLLQSLELSDIRVFGDCLRYSILEYGMHTKLADTVIQRGGLSFQKAISGLTQLTSLKLINVEFMECSAIPCSWTHLR